MMNTDIQNPASRTSSDDVNVDAKKLEQIQILCDINTVSKMIASISQRINISVPELLSENGMIHAVAIKNL